MVILARQPELANQALVTSAGVWKPRATISSATVPAYPAALPRLVGVEPPGPVVPKVAPLASTWAYACAEAARCGSILSGGSPPFAARRWLKIASAFPCSSAYVNRRGIERTDWIKIERKDYDECIDRRNYSQ